MIDVNGSLFLLVNRFAQGTGWLNGPVAAYATYGVVLFAVLLVAGWWSARASPQPAVMGAALWAPVGMLVALGVNQAAVAVVGEPRPYAVLDHPLLLVAPTVDPAFPSDHAVMAGAVAAGLWLVSRRLGALATAAALLMAAARVYVGAHWPGDVLAGLVLGAVVSLLGYALLRRALAGLVLRLARTRLWPLLTSAPRRPDSAAVS